MRIRIQSKKRSGATLVESAFVISIFLMFLFGIFEYGRFIMTRHLMESAAREGARFATVHTYDANTAAIQNEVDARLSVARKQLVGYNKTSNIQVYAADANGNPISGKQWDDCAFGERIGVTITGTYRPSVPNLLMWKSSFTVTVRAAMGSEAN